MANVIINDTNLTNIANAIREKNGTSETYKPNQMAAAILAIQGGGGELEVPEVISLSYGTTPVVNNSNAWDWVWKYMPPVTYEMYSAAQGAFSYVGAKEDLSHITIVMGGNYNVNTFFGGSNFTQAPKLILTATLGNTTSFFNGCNYLRSLPEDYFMIKDANTHQSTGVVCFDGGASRFGSMFAYCHSLRNHPKLNDGNQFALSTSGNASYSGMFFCCYALDKITDLPVVSNTYISDVCSGLFGDCFHLEDFTFETQADGTPFTANWSNQMLQFVNVGYFKDFDVAFGSGLPLNRQAKTAEDVLKWGGSDNLEDNNDWWTTDIYLSRYNQRSAYNTIVSLPDVSNGSGNVIIFNGDLGRDNGLSDAAGHSGAISNLPESDIALAAAKGWTVSFT